MQKGLTLSLQLLAVFFFWYIVVFMLSVLPLLGVSFAPYLQPEFRGDTYAWDFELFFTAIFAVWGVFLLKAAKTPQKHILFIDFTIWATIAHIAAMLVIGIIRIDDLVHLVKDAIALTLPLVMVIYFRVRTK